jgi:hypothetical protein
MSAIFASATLTAAGTPQRVSSSLGATLASVTTRGVTYAAGSATERVYQLMAQADPANTGANIYIGGQLMVKATRANIGAILAKTAPPVSLGQFGGSFALDDVWFDGDTTGDKLLLTLIG